MIIRIEKKKIDYVLHILCGLNWHQFKNNNISKHRGRQVIQDISLIYYIKREWIVNQVVVWHIFILGEYPWTPLGLLGLTVGWHAF